MWWPNPTEVASQSTRRDVTTHPRSPTYKRHSANLDLQATVPKPSWKDFCEITEKVVYFDNDRRQSISQTAINVFTTKHVTQTNDVMKSDTCQTELDAERYDVTRISSSLT